MLPLAAVGVPVCRVLGRIILARTSWWGIPAVVVGDAARGRAVVSTLQRWPELGVQPVALLTDGSDSSPIGSGSGGELAQAPMLAQKHDIPYAVLACPNLSYQERSRLLAHLGKFFQRLFVVSDGVGPHALWTTRNACHGLSGYGVRHYRFNRTARWTKRCVDLLGATAGLIALAPLFLSIAICIKVNSRGPVFFRQRRMTLEGRCFTVLKFRTMFLDAEERLQEILRTDPERRAEYEKYRKLDDDPRTTRVGQWLRRTSLDELPQLWNVIKGEMSLVGPRAYMPDELPKMNVLSQVILQCPPGITGLWQVSGRNHLDFDTRVQLDVHYMQNWTVWLDIYILIRTLPVVLSGDGAK